MITLDEFTIQQLREVPHATGELSGLLRCIGLAGKMVNAAVRKSGLLGVNSSLGTTNTFGEQVQKLDMIADDIFIKALQKGVFCAGVASEENNDIVVFDDARSNRSKYVVMFDPLDGSGNIDVTIGTIFSIYKRVTETGTPCTKKDFLQKGSEQIAAGYIIYGAYTMLIYATRRGVHGFTLDSDIGEFYLSHKNIRIPKKGKNFSFDFKYYHAVNDSVRKYIDDSLQGNNELAASPLSFRYAGCMVADIHRNLLKGGVFLYPDVKGRPHGKLRLMYECNPMAFITELAGGAASDGGQRILDIQPKHIHQTTPFFAGSRDMIISAGKDQ